MLTSRVIDLTVIIPSYNTKTLLGNCLDSIYGSTKRTTFEVICIDDNSPDGSADMVAELFPEVILVRNKTNQFYAKNNNLGLRMARGRYACLLNSDTVLVGDALSSMVEFMDSHPDAAACGPKLLNPDGTVQHCIRSFPSIAVMILQGINWHKLFPNNQWTDRYYMTHFDYSREQRVDSIGTTAYVIRRAIWENVAMLDERFELALVDLAYNLTLKRKGHKVYYTPAAEVTHFGSQSLNQTALRSIRAGHEAQITFSDSYDYFSSNRGVKMLIRLAIRVRYGLKLLEYYVSSDKRVIKGPGAPRCEQVR
jgi:N-acetylglucosaminyl-diphospho-decaprenol L-rhamnosyltransferase